MVGDIGEPAIADFEERESSSNSPAIRSWHSCLPRGKRIGIGENVTMSTRRGDATKPANDRRVSKSEQGTCKTCTQCRQKKIRCGGRRPKCHECEASGLNCAYPQDARSQRPTRAMVEGLEKTVSLLLDTLTAAGVNPPKLSEGLIMESDTRGQPERGSHLQGLRQLASTAADALPLPTPRAAGPNGRAMAQRSTATQGDVLTDHLEYDVYKKPDERANGEDVVVETSTLSPGEAQVVGVLQEDGRVSTVHGLAGIMNPTTNHKSTYGPDPTVARRTQVAIAASTARLISNAALQRQRETRIFLQPSTTLDLDGCPPDLAKHLISLHFNRQHYAYLVSYRPAIMSSLASGDGKWCNKLLLNAIFYSCAIYSDWDGLRSDPNDPQSVGKRFYERIKELLAGEIDKPSIPSAVALLLTSATLISQGRSSAGWTFSGTAFRMILDMGCHMTLMTTQEPNAGEGSSETLVHDDLEREMRKRLYWSAYITDSTQALYLGRPCMFASVESRVPLKLLDTYEELEDWVPFLDRVSSVTPMPAYAPQPAHAVSTFVVLVKLFQISTRITEIYGIQSMRKSHEALQREKLGIEESLAKWEESLPDHLRFDPDETVVPPPHQITPHTTYHALTILLQRAFLEQGHLRNRSTNEDQAKGKEACIKSAIMIQKYVRAYRDTFTLRRAPFLLSYAIYSAVLVILQQERHERGQYTDVISFFWTCLGELQRGCNFGLKKPLAILKDMVREFEASVKQTGRQSSHVGLDESFFSLPFDDGPIGSDPIRSINWMPQDQSLEMGTMPVNYFEQGDNHDSMFEGSPSEWLGFWNEQEKFISDDALYGLFANPD